MNRQEYLDRAGGPDAKQAHRTYYAQFVTPYVLNLVARTFTVSLLKASTDPHFNDIRLLRWDCAVPFLPASVKAALKAQGDYLTLGTGVCILKEAAQQIREGDVA